MPQVNRKDVKFSSAILSKCELCIHHSRADAQLYLFNFQHESRIILHNFKTQIRKIIVQKKQFVPVALSCSLVLCASAAATLKPVLASRDTNHRFFPMAHVCPCLVGLCAPVLLFEMHTKRGKNILRLLSMRHGVFDVVRD